jgi:hypothetical protein
VFKVDLVYYLGMYRSFISAERASNQVDMAYLYYLPFTMVFVSGDKLHRMTAPLFLRPDQSYVKAPDMKAALAQLDQHYDRLPDEVKAQGVMQFAGFPPPGMNNVVTRLWDDHMIPDWREIAAQQEAVRDQPRDKASDRELIRELNEQIDGATPETSREALPTAGPDYSLISRRVPVKKGKWRMLPEGIEEHNDDR